MISKFIGHIHVTPNSRHLPSTTQYVNTACCCSIRSGSSARLEQCDLQP